MLDLDYARRQFPALSDTWAFFDNAGGSLTARPVIDAVHGFMSRYQVQLGATYPRSVAAAEKVEEGHRAMARLLGGEPGEVVLGPSTTANLRHLAQALLPLWQAGDEVVVTDLDHEANIGPWLQLRESGMTVRVWPIRRDTVRLELEDLEPLLNERTRLVAVPHCSNITGAVLDLPAVARRVHEAGAWILADGVAFAPHRRVDVRRLGVDFYVMSSYKAFGPHLGVLWGRRSLLRAARGQNHFFIREDDVPYKLQPGSVIYELAAALPGIVAYLEALAARSGDGTLEHAFALITEHERALAKPLLELLAATPGVRVLGPPTTDPARRVPIVSFVVEGRSSAEIPPLLERQHLAVRFGHFYTYRAIDHLGLLEGDGVIRVSMAHYNSPQEVERLLTTLRQVLPRA